MVPQGAWLEEQRAELRDRSEERRRLAAAWAEFHTRERLSRERAEQDKERALGMDAALRSLAKVPDVPKPLALLQSPERGRRAGPELSRGCSRTGR